MMNLLETGAGLLGQATSAVGGLANAAADMVGVSLPGKPIYKIELLPKDPPPPVDNSAAYEELAEIKRKWNAELDKATPHVNEYESKKQMAEAASAEGNLPLADGYRRAARAAADKAIAIRDAARKKYAARHDQLEAQLKPPAEKTTNLTPTFAKRLLSMTLTDNRGFESDQLDLVLDDADGQLEIPPRGARLKVAIGWEASGLVDKGIFIVDEVEHTGSPDTLTIRARATDLRAGISTKKERSWHKTSVGDIVRAIAKANQLTPIIPAWLAKRPVEHIDQTSESDANLLTRLAEQHDAICTVKGGRLIFCKAGDAESVTGKPFPQLLLTRRSGDQHRFAAADRNAYTAVKAYWHNLDAAQKGEVYVDGNTKFERKSTVTKRGKLTKRKHLTATQQKAIEPSAANVKVLRHIYASEGTALQAAKAAWEKIQRGVAELSITLRHGREDIFPELPIQVSGFKPAIDACGWTVSKVTHSLSNSGFITALELEMRLEDLNE